jgi:hypothetical protein
MSRNGSLRPEEPVLTPERKVWRAVLQQAYEDAELEVFADGTEPIERGLARGLLRADSEIEKIALSLICEFASVPADRVISWARRRYSVPRDPKHAMAFFLDLSSPTGTI